MNDAVVGIRCYCGLASFACRI